MSTGERGFSSDSLEDEHHRTTMNQAVQLNNNGDQGKNHVTIEPTGCDQEKNEASENDQRIQDEIEQEESNFQSLCRLMAQLGPETMQQVFSSIHPAINLSETLSRPGVTVALRRLRALKLISTEQWDTLYPMHHTVAVTTGNSGRRSVSAYEPSLVYLLLRTICSLSAPYPDGWFGLPLNSDTSLSADLVRLQWFRTLLAEKCRTEGKARMTDKEYSAYWQQIRDVLVRLGGNTIKVRIGRLERDKPYKANGDVDYLKLLQSWDDKARDLQALEKEIQKSRGNNDLSILSDSFPDNSGNKSQDQGDGVRNSERYEDGGKRTGRRQGAPTKQRSQHTTREVTTLSKEELQAHERSVLLKFYRPLTETVQSDDVLPKLIQCNLMSHEEKNRISLATRNADRMKAVLELVSKRVNSGAFDKLCDVIKYKYKKLSDQLVKAKLSPLKVEKPDERTLCQAVLKSAYSSSLGTLRPFPWHSDIKVAAKDFLIPQYITDFYGRRVTPEQLFTPHHKCDNPRRILLAGQDGVGKSTLLRNLAYQWAVNGTKTQMRKFQMVFLLDLRKVTVNITDAIIEQCLAQGGFVRSPSELHSLLEAEQKNILFLLDGYENMTNINSNLWDLVHQSLYPQCSVIMTANLHSVTSSMLRYYDTELVLLGIEQDRQEDLVRRYGEVTKTPVEKFAGLLTKVISEYNTTLRTYSLAPLYALSLCMISETGGNLDIHTMSAFMAAVILATQRLYCEGHDLTMAEDSIPDEIMEATLGLEKLAFKMTIEENQASFSYRTLLDCMAGPNKSKTAGIVVEFGLLEVMIESHNSLEDTVYAFHHPLLRQFLAARFLSRQEPEGFKAHVEELVNNKDLHNTTLFFCGIHRFDYNLKSLRELFTLLAETNKHQMTPIRHNRGRILKEHNTNQTEGRLSSISLTLDCLAECEGRKDLMEIVQDNIPNTLYMKHRSYYSPLTIIGLSQVLRSPSSKVTEIELRLDHVAAYYEHFFMILADVVEKSSHILTLRIKWTRDDILALFLANVFVNNKTLCHLYLCDESRAAQDEVSATVCSNLWTAGNNMNHLQTVAFTRCKNPAVVTSFVRNIPKNLRSCSFSYSRLDLIGAQEIATMVEKSHSLHVLDLSGVTMKRSDFLYITYGLKLNKSLKELVLTDFMMDETCITALAEAIKFNTTIRVLDLRRSTLSTESCRALGCGLSVNKSLVEVNMSQAQIQDEGVRILRRLARDGVLLTGLEGRGIIYKRDPTLAESMISPPDIKE